MNPLRFELNAVRASGTLHFAGRIKADEYQDAVSDAGNLASPLDVEIDLKARGEEIDCQGKVRGTWALECCRCLARAETPFSAKVDATFPADGYIDAREEVRQAIALAMPYRFFCKPDCKGLCPRCKKNLNLGSCTCTQGDFNA